MPSYDGVVIGAGHNSLTLAAYLSRAGLKIAVLERNAAIGGGAITLPLALSRIVEAAGGLVMTDAEIKEVRTESGRATGVRLAGGETISGSTGHGPPCRRPNGRTEGPLCGRAGGGEKER